MIWYFVFFFVSGFCGILYEIVWLRLAMAQFGVTNALVSIVLSMFMAGLGLGSWESGLLARRYGDRAGTLGLRLYALAELLIGISTLLVPLELRWGRALLEGWGCLRPGRTTSRPPSGSPSPWSPGAPRWGQRFPSRWKRSGATSRGNRPVHSASCTLPTLSGPPRAQLFPCF